MKRAIICVTKPWEVIKSVEKDYSLMIVNPDQNINRLNYLLNSADFSILITDHGTQLRDGGDYPDEKLVWYTSGTTGDSKFYGFSQDQLDHMCGTIINAYDITANDRYFNVMPLWHGHGQGFYWATRLAGCEVNFGTIKNTESFKQFRPTFVTAIPDMLPIMMRLDLKNLRFVRSASSPLPANLFNQLNDRWNCPIIEAFGMTEALSHCFTNPLKGEKRIGTVGLPDGIEAQIDNEGHLLIRGPSVVKKNEWLDTGDLAEQDEKGYYRILGRSIDQLNIRGKKFNPLSLESQVLKHITAVKECVIFGNHELNCLYVGDCDPKEILTFLLSLDPHLRPAMLNKTDEIPLQHAGKISRSYLKKLFNCN